jgi:hypothetical protein
LFQPIKSLNHLWRIRNEIHFNTFILLAFKAEAQVVVKPTTTSTLTFQSKTTLKIDTVKCMMLVCDTSRIMNIKNGIRVDTTRIGVMADFIEDTAYLPPASNS